MVGAVLAVGVADTTVTGLLAGIYGLLVLLATRVLSLDSPAAVAASTLAAAALFSPMRRRGQSWPVW